MYVATIAVYNKHRYFSIIPYHNNILACMALTDHDGWPLIVFPIIMSKFPWALTSMNIAT